MFRLLAIIDEVKQAVSSWKEYADDAGVDPIQGDQIQQTLRLNDF